jgi:DNA-binding winged helix-turn-helix (wHTH) protein
MSKNESQIYEFGPFRLHAHDRILLRGDAEVHLTAKVFNILLLLVQRSGHLVTKEELIEQVWPDAMIEENNLTVSMSALRKALGDRKEGGPYIETVSRHGYRFVASVSGIEDAAVRPADKYSDPNFHISRALVALVYLEKGSFEEAISELEKMLTINDSWEISALLGYAFAVSGRADEARNTLKELRAVASKTYLDPALLAVIYTGLKEKKRALEYLRKAHENRSVWLPFINVCPLFDSLRSDHVFHPLSATH